MKKLFSIFCCLLLSASMVTQAQESPIRDADVSATSSQIIVDETELLDDGIYVGDVTGPRKAPAATAYAMMKNSTVQYAEIMKLSTTNCYKIIIKVTNNYGGALKTGFVVTSFNTGSNTKIGGNHQFSSSYSNCTESDNWFTQNYSSSTGALYVDNPYGYIQFTYQSMGADGYPIYRIYIHDCYGYTSNNGCINWKSSGAIFSWDNNVSVHPMNANKDRIDFTDYYTISVSSNNNSYGTVSGGGTYAAGAARTLTASVASSSYQFLGWKKNGGSSYVSTSASYNVTVNGNDSYVAEFAPKAAPQYTITTAVSPSNTYGTVTGAGSYYENNPATLTATSANEHLYIFDHWLKDGNNYAGGATITPTVTAAATYTAVFRNAAEGTITGVANYGTISGTGHYTGGSAVTLTVTPNSGYKFAQWSDGNEDNPRTVYVDGDATYTAQFTDLNQPLLASFSWDDDDISVEQYGDGNSLCNSFYAPYGKNFYMLYAKANSRSSKNYLNLSIQSSQSQMWGDLSFFKVGDYPVVGSSLTTNTIQCDGDWYSHAEWFWSLDQTNVCVAYGYDSYDLGLNPLGTYLCDKSGSAEDDSDQSNYISVTEGMTCKITVGKKGDPYIRLVRNSDQQCMVSVGEAAVMHTITINPATNGTITVKDGETIINSGDQVIEGTTLTVTTTPATGYHFDSWTNNGAASVTVNSDVTIGATFAINTYTVTVAKNEDGWGTISATSVANVPYGTVITTGTGENANKVTINGTTVTATPAASDAQYTYAFSGWTNGAATVTGNMTVTANFTRTVNTYDITFKNADGTTLKKLDGTTDAVYSVAYGETPAYDGATPTKDADSEYTYTFNGWDNEIVAVTEDATYTATYSTTKVQYTLTWDVNGGNALTGTYTSGTIDWGTAITHPADPTKSGYTFNGWDADNDGTADDVAATMPTDNVTYKALWILSSMDALTLLDKESATYYDNFQDYDGVEVETVTYARNFTAGNWSTLCLPFDVTEGNLINNGLSGQVFAFQHATGNANVGSQVLLYFIQVSSLEAGVPYLVRTRNNKSNFTFENVTINTEADTEADITDLGKTHMTEGTIALVGTLRKGTLPKGDKHYMGLMGNKIYYPGENTTVPAYRAYFYDSNPSGVQQRVRIVVDGEDMGELLIDNGELLDAGGDDRAPRKYIRNGVLVIEREGVTYDAQGKRM